MADSPTERRPRTPLPPRQDAGPPGKRPGTPPRGRMPRLPFGRTFWIVVASLLVINYLSATLLASGKRHSVRIPYNPAFLQQVDKGNVKRISTTGATVDGEFKKAIRYPDDKADPTTNFETEIPSFELYDGNTLTEQLISKNVEISAE